MTNVASTTLAPKLRLAAVATICALGFGLFNAAPAEASSRDHKTRCVAQAKTVYGDKVRGTKTSETRWKQRKACRVAVRKCEDRINRRTNPYAQCEVIRRVKIDVRPKATKVRYRCEAEAFTRRGRALSKTFASDVAKKQRSACRTAINRCERRLDDKRYDTGRNFPNARCEVVGKKKVTTKRKYSTKRRFANPLLNYRD
ncbi:MAG: hypothetical protein AAFZ06_11620 [Pseudomonadota bacterium]